jgi:hypothetical protein
VWCSAFEAAQFIARMNFLIYYITIHTVFPARLTALVFPSRFSSEVFFYTLPFVRRIERTVRSGCRAAG